jgi:hypothetical protein
MIKVLWEWSITNSLLFFLAKWCKIAPKKVERPKFPNLITPNKKSSPGLDRFLVVSRVYFWPHFLLVWEFFNNLSPSVLNPFWDDSQMCPHHQNEKKKAVYQTPTTYSSTVLPIWARFLFIFQISKLVLLWMWYYSKRVECEGILILTGIKLCTQNPIKDGWSEPSQGRQKGKAKERPKDTQPAATKKKKVWGERASPSHGRKLSHSHSL